MIHGFAVATGAPSGGITAGGEIIIAMIGGTVTLVGLWFQFVYRPRERERGVVLEKVRHQVENSHETNLRDDLDRIERTVDAVAVTVRHLAESVATVHDEVTTVRDDQGGLHRALAGVRRDITELRKP